VGRGGNGLSQGDKLNPNNARAHHWFALNLAQLGRAEEALQEVGIAQKLDPLAPIIPAARAKILLTDHQFKEAVAENQKALELEPNFAPAYSVLAQALAFQGQYEDAIAAARKYVDLTGGGDQELLELAYAQAVGGKKVEAQQIVTEVQQRGENFSQYDMAAICAALDDRIGALFWLKRAIERHSIDVIWVQVDPRLDSMRNEDGFRALVEQVVSRASSGG
jgi:Flp pilus assembly protein TadD